MADSLFEIIKIVVQSAIPILLLILGGQRLLNRYELKRKQSEQELGLVRFIRERQYEAVQELCELYARFMALYRIINADHTNLGDSDTRSNLFKQVAEAEAAVDAVILRIGSEFTSGDIGNLEVLLGNLRQSVQIWREQLRAGDPLPFNSSEQPDYVRFKAAFAGTCAYMVSQIYQSLEPPETKMGDAQKLLTGATSNRYEFLQAREEFLRLVQTWEDRSRS